MYIGPWQEYKLARILQLKDKVEQEEKESNKLEANTAVSVSNKGHFNMQTNEKYANSEGFKYITNGMGYAASDKYSDSGLSEQPINRHSRVGNHKNVKKQYRHKSHNLPKPKMSKHRNLVNVPTNKQGFNNNYVGGTKPKNFGNASPTSNNTNYSSKVIKSTTNSFKNGERLSTKSGVNLPSNRTLRAGSNDKLSYMNSTNNSEARSYAGQMIHEMRKHNFFNQFNKQNVNR
jgi:hypothetical protein